MRAKTAYKMLLHSGTATTGAILGVVSMVFLVGLQMGLLFALINEMSILVTHSGADYWIVSKNVINSDYTGTLPMSYIDRVYGLEEVLWAKPTVLSGGKIKGKDGHFENIRVIGIERPMLRGGPWNFEKGNINNMLDLRAMTLNTTDLESFNYPRINDRIEVSSIRLQLLGITKHADTFGGRTAFANLANARKIAGISSDRCHEILIKIKPQFKPSPQIESRIKNMFPFATVYSTQALAKSTYENYLAFTGAGVSLGLAAAAAAVVGFVVVLLTLYTGVLNYLQNFAILRALGARKKDILLVIVFQVLIIAGIGIFLGFVLLSIMMLIRKESTLPLILPLWFSPLQALITLMLCFLGSFFAMRKALSVDPASAFR